MGDDSSAADTARRVWRLLEPVHAVTYFAPEAQAAYLEAGVRGFWRGYFAGRAAPLGRVTAVPVLACFYGFAPAMVTRALPAIWELISPEDALRAREAGALAALTRLDAETSQLAANGLAEVNEMLAGVLARLEHAGRILGAVNAALPRPEHPLAQLWHAATVVREHRGDGHVAALVAAGLGPCETLAWRSANDLSRDVLQPARGWTDEEWAAGCASLVARGWFDSGGQPTALGVEAFRDVERRTDLTAAPAWEGVDVDRLSELLTPLSGACIAHFPAANPIGLRPPAAS